LRERGNEKRFRILERKERKRGKSKKRRRGHKDTDNTQTDRIERGKELIVKREERRKTQTVCDVKER
jgi:hypothetical protein